MSLARRGSGALALLLLALVATTTLVRQGEAVLLTRLGRPVGVLDQPGLHLRLPWPIDEALPLDLRSRVYETGHTEMLTRDKRNVVVKAYAVWRIADPERFYITTGTFEGADEKLGGLLTNAAIGVLGRYDLAALVSTDPSTLAVDALEADLLAAVQQVAREQYGLEVGRTALMRLSLPEENVDSVFEQMRAERRQAAARFQAEGELEASRLRAEADLQAAEIRAAGTEEAARLLGEAEAEAAQIYAEAHRKAPELYHFTRSLETLDQVVGPQTTIILRTDSEPFRLLETSQ